MSEEYPSREAASIVDILCAEVLSVPLTSRLMSPGQEVPAASAAAFDACVGRLLSGEPLQYVLGFADFYGHRFRVTPSVLIPRPETELLCDHAIRLARERLLAGSGPASYGRRLRILDLCTGSGCIAWTMAAAFPDAEVVGVDISAAALDIARSQAICPNAPAFILADVLSPDIPAILSENCETAGFDIILSNPPYVMESEKPQMRRNVLEHEPAMALFVPDGDPLVFYRAIASLLSSPQSSSPSRGPQSSSPSRGPQSSSPSRGPQSPASSGSGLLVPGGFCLVEINEALGPRTAALFSSGLTVSVLPDLSGRDRFVLSLS